MTIDQAIAILDHWLDDLDEWNKADTDGAVKLGIEALKRIKAIRPYSNSDKSYYLPGETKKS